MKLNADPIAIAFFLERLQNALDKSLSITSEEYESLVSNKKYGKSIEAIYAAFFENEYGRGGEVRLTKFIPNAAAEFIDARIPYVIIDNVFFIYVNGAYIPDKAETKIRLIINNLIVPEKRGRAKITEVLTILRSLPAHEKTIEEMNRYPDSWICFENGMFDAESGIMHDHSPKYLCLNKIPHKYDKDAELCGPVTDAFLKDLCGTEENETMLLAFLGLCMTKDTRLQKAFIIHGRPGTGKSTLLRYAEKMIGERNRSALSLEQLCNNRFAAYGILGKTFNFCPDISARIIEDTATFKKITGEDSLAVEQKGKDLFSVRPYAKLIYSANELPPIKTRDNAFFRRVLLLNVRGTQKKAVPGFENQLHAEVNYLIKKCVSALCYLYSLPNMDSIETEESKKAREKWEVRGNSVFAYILDKEPFDATGRVKKGEFEQQYFDYCREEDRVPFSRHNIKIALENRGYKHLKSNGENYYIDPTFSAKKG